MKTFNALAALVCLAAVSGCSLLKPVAVKVGDAVGRYCKEPYQERLLIRETVNAEAAPNAVKITCEGDPE